MSVEPLGVHHVSINVRDAAEGLAFYTDAMGLRERDDRPNFMAALGGGDGRRRRDDVVIGAVLNHDRPRCDH